MSKSTKKGLPCRVLGASADQCPNCLKYVDASKSRKKKLYCHRTTSKMLDCGCFACASRSTSNQAAQPDQNDDSQPKRRRRAAPARVSDAPSTYREDEQVVAAARHATHREKQARKRRKDPQDEEQQGSGSLDSPGGFVSYIIRHCHYVITLCQQLVPRHPQA